MAEPILSTGKSHTRILVVDDHPGTAATLARALSQLDPQLEVLSATNGKNALEQVRDAAVDVLITDMMMPQMNGLELIENLQSHPGGRPAYTILITAYDLPGLKETARRLRVNDTIFKPFRTERICQVVGRALEEMGRSKVPSPVVNVPQPFKVLVADDAMDNLVLLSRYLQNEGCSLITASNGVEALDKTRSELPDLILLDINMPEKDGFQVLRELRADVETAHIPVIVLTAARPDPIDIQHGLELGADDYVTKPFDRRELLARIRTKLRVKEADDALRRRHGELKVLAEIARLSNLRSRRDGLLTDILRCVVEGTGANAAFLVNPDHSLAQSHPRSAAETAQVQIREMFQQADPACECRVVEDVRIVPPDQTAPVGGIHAAVIVPISGSEGGPLGTLLVTHIRPGFFRTEIVPFMQAVANQIALAIENARLVTALQGAHLES